MANVTTNFNVDPYYDDYNEDRQYLRVLFRPGYAVQGREMTQLQTILQKQSSRLGDHIFKDGSAVLGGELTLDTQVTYLKLIAADTAATFAGGVIKDSTGLVRAQVVTTDAAVGTDPPTLYIKFISGTTFVAGSTITLDGTSTTGTIASTNHIGNASIASINRGVYFVSGFFALCLPQTLVLEKYSNTPTYRVGLTTTESIVDSTSDATLLDPSTGTTNANAPGATRFKIALTLAKKTTSSTDPVAANADSNFIELLRIVAGSPTKHTKYPVYGEIERTLARRTYDESGDYTVRPFPIRMVDHQGASGTTTASSATTITGILSDFENDFEVNDSIYVSSATTTYATVSSIANATSMVVSTALGNGTAQRIHNRNRVSAALDPGKAYVKGYEYESIATEYVDVKKGRGTQTQTAFPINPNFGNYFKVKGFRGGGLAVGGVTFDPESLPTMDIHCVANTGITSTNVNTYNSTKIGTTRVRQVDYSSGTFSTVVDSDAAIFDLYVFDTQFSTVSTTVGTNYTSGALTIILTTATSSTTNDAYNGAKITIGSETRTITDYDGATHTATLSLGFSASHLATVAVIINFSVREVECLAVANTTTFALDGPQFGIDDSSKVNVNDTTSNTQIFDSSLSSLVFPIGFDNIKNLNNQGLTYRRKDTIAASFSHSGTATSATFNAPEGKFLNEGLSTGASLENEKGSYVAVIDAITTQTGVTLTLACTTVNGDATVTVTSGNTNSLRAGMAINTTGPGVPNSATVASVTNLTSFEMSAVSSGGDSGSGNLVFGGTATPSEGVLAIGQIIDINAVVASDTQLTLTPVRTGVVFASGTTFTAKVYSTLDIVAKAEKVKTKVTATSPAAPGDIKDNGNILTNTNNRLANGQMIVASFAGTQSLQVSDVTAVSSIIEANTTVNTMVSQYNATVLAAVGNTAHVNNITSRYTFNDGQKDNSIDHSSITLKPGQAKPANNVLILFDYFTHTPTDGYASVESYTNIDYADIPSFTSPVSGVTRQLRDCLDFRPVKSISASGTLQTNEDIPDADTSITANTIFYLPRKDKLTLTKDRVYKVLNGVSAENTILPADDDDAMTLYSLDIPAYTFNSSDVDTQYVDNRRFTMRDIGKIEKRVDTLEYYTALSLLEKEASDLSVKDYATNLERFKNGILVDSFNGHNIGDVSHADFAIAVDQELKELRPPFSSDSFKFTTALGANTQKTGDLVTLRYSSSNLVVQPLCSNTETINPFGTSQFNGQLSLSPPSDVWFSETGRPLVLINLESLNDHWIQGNENGFGKQWDDWSSAWSGSQVNDDNLIKTRKSTSSSTSVSRSTSVTSKNKTRTGIISTKPPETIKRSVGNRAVSISIVPFIREQKVHFVAKGLKPSSTFYPYFDNTLVSAYTKDAFKITYSANTSSANSGTFDTNTGQQVTLTQSYTLGAHVKTATGLALYQNSTSVMVSSLVNDVTMTSTPAAMTVGETITFYSDSARTLQVASGILQSYLTTTANNFTVNAISGTIATGHYVTGSASGDTAGSVSDAGGFRTGEISNGLAGDSKANGNITAVGTSLPTLATTLTADIHGILVGEFELPATTFKSGEKLLRLTDSETDSVASTESVAEKIFRVQGLLESRTGKISSTRPMESKRENVKEKAVTQDTINRVTTSTNWVNPLTQSFLVDQNENPNGIFASSIDIFFSAIDDTLPVTLALRPIVNGFPSSSQILPFSEITLNAVDTVANSTVPSVATSSTYTRFTFESPVYLYPDEYAIVMTSPSTSYKVHVANLGETVKNTTSTKVSQQPFVASFYQPQNSSVWQANAEKQMMFRVNRCEFDTGTHATYFSSEATPLSGNTSGPAYDVFKLSTSDLTFSNTALTFSYKGILTANSDASVTNDSSRNTNLDAAWTEFSPNMNYTLSGQKKFISSRSTTGPVTYAANNFYMKSTFTSNDSKISPAVDMSRMNLITVENLVKRGSLANSDFVVTAGGSGYGSTAPTITISGGGGTGATPTAVLTGGVVTSISCTAAQGGSGYYETPTIAFSSGAAAATIQNELAKSGGNAKARYISRRVTLEDSFDAQDIKVWLNAFKPKDTDIKVYYRVHNSEDPTNFEERPYVLMTQETDANKISASETDINEYVFRSSANNVSYTSSNVTYDKFKTFVIKIVLGSASTSIIPKVKDMKAVALDF
ncbi:MAG: hypothetical protein CXT78_01680 [Thaumarchaeota archaeon]|nr:MAG: hypothetical protein CXT78_01680 [Nitrososphaerota archaeon]